MKFSIITVCYNSADTLSDAIRSVMDQDHPDLEYIIIDGGSTDGTSDIVASFGDRIDVYVSEPDKGIYDAMNKGIARASGEVIGILNADDYYAHSQVISKLDQAMNQQKSDAAFADLVYVSDESPEQIARYYPGKGFLPRKMLSGNMPPHPTFFVKKIWYDQLGTFDTSFAIASDFEWMVRYFLVAKGSYVYVPEVIVKMRLGGSSTSGLSSTLTINREMLNACKKHGLRTSLPRIYSKYFTKIFQLWKKPDPA